MPTSTSSSGSSSQPGQLPRASAPVAGATRGSSSLSAIAASGGAASGGGAFAGGGYLGSAPAAGSYAAAVPAPQNVSSTQQAAAHATRTYITTSKRSKRRPLVVKFRLAHRARVVFTVFELYPNCRRVTSFVVAGHRGVNRVKVRRKIAGKLLEPGTYRINARVAGGTPLFQLVLAVVKTRPTAKQLAFERNRNACASPALALVTSSDGAAGALTATVLAPKTQQTQQKSEIVRQQNAIPVVGAKSEQPPSASAFSPTRISQNATNPFVILALVAAMVLLGLAALPRTAIPDARLTDTLVRHRLDLVLGGATALAAAAFALFLA